MKFLTVLFVSALPLFGLAQSVSPEVIASAGDHFSNGSVQLSWTLGEVMIDTYDNGTHILTQGFHQTELTVTSIEEQFAEVRLNLYPNPTSNELHIQVSNNSQDILLQLYDMTGKLLHKDVIRAFGSEYVLPLRSVATGKYLLQMHTEDGSMRSTHQVVKVQADH